MLLRHDYGLLASSRWLRLGFAGVRSRSSLGQGAERHAPCEELGSWGPAGLFTPIPAPGPVVSNRQGPAASIQLVLSNTVVLA